MGYEFAAQFQHHAFGGFLADAGGGGEAFHVFFGDGLRQLVGIHGRQNAQCGFGTDAADFDQLAEGGAFLGRGKSKQQMRVFADDKLGVEMDGFANGRQVVESLHRNVGFITDAVDVDNDLRRIFLNQFACEPADHGVPL